MHLGFYAYKPIGINFIILSRSNLIFSEQPYIILEKILNPAYIFKLSFD
ncbi:MAG: hypothetical protein ACK52J_05075 [bacterium]